MVLVFTFLGLLVDLPAYVHLLHGTDDPHDDGLLYRPLSLSHGSYGTVGEPKGGEQRQKTKRKGGPIE